jgi:hypothetical protein
MVLAISFSHFARHYLLMMDLKYYFKFDSLTTRLTVYTNKIILIRIKKLISSMLN